jgi:hypothetical protein
MTPLRAKYIRDLTKITDLAADPAVIRADRHRFDCSIVAAQNYRVSRRIFSLKSQRRAVLSSLPVTTQRLSGLIATALIQPSWPRRTTANSLRFS